MRLYFGDKCPAYEHRICVQTSISEDYSYNYCNSCEGCKAHFIDGVECGYSPKPNCVPKFKEGQEVYRFFHLDLYNKAKIRKIEWDGYFQWQYTMARERTPYKEDEIFATKQEIDTYVINKHVEELKNELLQFSKEYRIPIESLKRKLIE